MSQQASVMKHVLLFVVAVLASASLVRADDAATAAKDKTIVETLLRLKNIDVHARPPLKEAVLRHLKTIQGTPKYLELIERFEIRDNNDELLRILQADPASTAGLRAARLLLKFDDVDRLRTGIADNDDKLALNTVTALGLVGNAKAMELLQPLVKDKAKSNGIRNAAVTGLGKNINGQRYLLTLVKAKEIDKPLEFSVANALYGSADASIRDEVAKHITLPKTKGSKPLPPVSELVKMRGDVSAGKTVFAKVGTCIKCHKVRGEGKEVGPDLSEIGSKLARDAMFVSILDPSAGISHNYESYLIATDEGVVLTGLKVSETDDSFTIRTAEAIDRKLAKDEIEQLKKQKISLMPADLQKDLTVDDLVNVVEYLTTLKKK